MEAMTENKVVPTLRFREFEKDWGVTKLSDLTKVYDGTHQTPKYVAQGIPFYSVEHVTANQFEKTKFISEDVFEKENKRVKLQKGDILMTRIGSIGVARIIDWDVNASFYVSLALVKANQLFCSSFFAQLIHSTVFQRELWRRTIHVAFPKKINLGEFSKCVIHLPTLPEQQKIATFLSSVDAKLQQLSKKKSLLADYKKGVMQKIFSQELRFKDANGNNYPDWEEKKLGEHSNKISSGKSKCEEYGQYIVYGSTGQIGFTSKWSHTGKYLLIARVGANAGLINCVDGDFGVTDNTLVLDLKEGVCIEYIYYSLLFFNLNRLVFGSGQPLITGGQLKKLKLNIPSISEQQQIANFLSALDTKIEKVNTQIENTQAFKKGLLQQMFV